MHLTKCKICKICTESNKDKLQELPLGFTLLLYQKKPGFTLVLYQKKPGFTLLPVYSNAPPLPEPAPA
jgi:hypothetical protein